jgi:hypothetical protein
MPCKLSGFRQLAGSGRIVARPEVGGLHHRYEREWGSYGVT